MSMWNFLVALGVGGAMGKTKTAQRLKKPLLLVFAVGVLIAGVIYAIAVFRAISERSDGHHVHAHSTR